jgi:hypothetical protein
MRFPYVDDPLDALLLAQACVGLLLLALLWVRPYRPRYSGWLILLAIGLVILAPVGTPPYARCEILRQLGLALGQNFAKPAMKLAAASATLGAFATGRASVWRVALAGEAVLWAITDCIRDSDGELAALHLAFLGLLVGIHSVAEPSSPSVEDRRGTVESPGLPLLRGLWTEDVIATAAGTLAGCVVCGTVTHGYTIAGDEWANTFQAALFAKLRAYGSVPPCAESFRGFFVYDYMGRSFGQYTPAWPAFMAPFVAVGATWLAGPVSLGMLCAGVGRLGRRAVAGTSTVTELSMNRIRLGGRLAAAVVALSSSIVLNGASRFPHVFVAAMFAWSVEALFAVSTPGLTRHEQRRWAILLGAAASLMMAARPADGCTLGLGPLVYLAFALAKGRIRFGALAPALATFAFVAFAVLIVLRLQLGQWFKTGYSLLATFHPWASFGWSLPKANQYRWGFPLAAGAYCWAPCSPAVGLAGLVSVRGEARRAGIVLAAGCSALVVLYTLAEFGRVSDWGYGPRYLLPCIVPMAVGTGVVLEELCHRARWSSARVHSLDAYGPLALAVVAIALSVGRIAPSVFAFAGERVRSRNRLHEALSDSPLEHAVVFVDRGVIDTDPHDLIENLPIDLYPNQPALIAIDRGSESIECVRREFPDRALYRALPGPKTKVVPY